MATKLTDEALDTIFRSGRSYNGYTDTPITEADLHAIWDLMKFGPTSVNMMPARLVWCLSVEAKEKLAAVASGSNGDKIRKAPASVIIGMDLEFHEHLPTLFPHVDARSWFLGDGKAAFRKDSAFRNSSLQGAYFIIAARALGFDSGPMSGFDNAAVDAAFFADTPNVTSNFIATLGVGDSATVFGRSPRPPFETFNRIV